ncbi:MAG: hypothetical protein E6460_02300, partial [Klebsiella michiganensis]|nr:hypothetical protein [Klebsiella michiganensis]
VARSAQRHREESTPIHHSGTFPAGGTLRLVRAPARRQRWTGSPAKRSASRGETTPIHHSGTFPAGGALRLSGLPARRQRWTCSPVSAAPPGINQCLQQGQQKYDFAQLNRRA